MFEKRWNRLLAISYFTAVMENIVLMVLIYFATTTDICLWYFVLLLSPAARFRFVGVIFSPVLFSM
ncbi:MAG: hypothetical protein ACUVWJ_12490 [Spirochaetota bacterium]